MRKEDFHLLQKKQLAEEGDAEAQSCSERFYSEVSSTQFLEKAFYYFQLTADSRNPDAQDSLKLCYARIYDTGQPYEKTIKFFAISANKGNPKSHIK